MELVEREADALRAAAKHLLAGGSLMAVSKQWQEQGIKSARGRDKMTVTSIRRLLTRARNAGLIEQDGKIIGPALWPAIFDVDTLHAVRAVLSDPGRRTATSWERVHQGAGVYVCGRCGAFMRVFKAKGPGGKPAQAYRCEASPHLSQMKEPLDEFVSALVVAYLSREGVPMAADVHGVDLVALQSERDGLQARKDELAAMFAAGTIDGSQLRRGSADLQAKIDSVDGRLAAVRETSPLAELADGSGDIEERWAALSPDVRGKVISQLMTVTVLPVGSGARPRGEGLNVDRINIEWKV